MQSFKHLKTLITTNIAKYAVYGAGILQLTFPNINLPDSIVDLDGSQGFVQFIISPKQNVLPGDVIENEADIYFDNNAPTISFNNFESKIQILKIHTCKHPS